MEDQQNDKTQFKIQIMMKTWRQPVNQSYENYKVEPVPHDHDNRFINHDQTYSLSFHNTSSWNKGRENNHGGPLLKN